MTASTYSMRRVWLLTRFLMPLIRPFLAVLIMGFAALLVWREVRFREVLAEPMPAIAATPPAFVSSAPDTTAIATVLGFTDATAPVLSAQPLTLLASFVRSQGLSRALLADAQGPRVYQVGELLPGGSVLRRVELNQVVLWTKGREEVLTLQPASGRFLRRIEPQTAAPATVISKRFLRPLAGQSE